MTYPELKKTVEGFWRSQDWTLCDAAVAKNTGATYAIVRNWRRKLGIPMGRSGKLTGLHGNHPRFQRLTASDFTTYDAEMARIHGITRERVRQIRKSLGLPPSRKPSRKSA